MDIKDWQCIWDMAKTGCLRIMKKFDIKPPRRRVKRSWITVSTNNHSYTNLIKDTVPKRPAQIFVSDLTCLKYQNKKYYLVTVEDIFTREIISVQMSDTHDSRLAFLFGRSKPFYGLFF